MTNATGPRRLQAPRVCTIVGAALLVVPWSSHHIAHAQYWQAAGAVAGVVGSYVTDRKRSSEYKKLKAILNLITDRLAKIDKKLVDIQETLVALGDYLESEFDAIYVNEVRSNIELARQDLDRFSSSPWRHREQIRTSLDNLRRSAAALHNRPPEGYDWVGSAMAFEDSLANLLPARMVSRNEIFSAHATYFFDVISQLQPTVEWLDESIKQIEQYHDELGAKRPILQFETTRTRTTGKCWMMEVKVYRQIDGSLTDGYTLTKRRSTRDTRCLVKYPPRQVDDIGHGRLSVSADEAGAPEIGVNMLPTISDEIGTPMPEDNPPVIPKRVVIGQLNASRKDWLERRTRREILATMIDECRTYMAAAESLASSK